MAPHVSVIILAACQVACNQQVQRLDRLCQITVYGSLFYFFSFTKICIKTPACGQALLFVHAEVPLSHHVRGIASLLHQLGEELLIQGHAVGLAGPDDLVLHACVDLQGTEHEVAKALTLDTSM